MFSAAIDAILNEPYTPIPPKELSALLKRAKRGDVDAKQAIILRNARLIAKVVREFVGPNFNHSLSADDLFQEGCEIFLKRIIPRYNGKTKLSTFATVCLQNHLRRVVANHGHTIRIPVGQQSRLRRITYHADRLETCDVPTLASASGLSPIQVRTIQHLPVVIASLDKERRDNPVHPISVRHLVDHSASPDSVHDVLNELRGIVTIRQHKIISLVLEDSLSLQDISTRLKLPMRLIQQEVRTVIGTIRMPLFHFGLEQAIGD